MRKHAINRLRFCGNLLEKRISPAVFVTNTGDYDPVLYVAGDPTTFLPGSFRYAIQTAIDAFNDPVNPRTETIFFDQTVDLGNNTHFGDPINEFNTVNLLYGSLGISTPMSILAPRFGSNQNDYVRIRWTGQSPNAPIGSDWSVFQIGMKAITTGTPTRPDYGAAVTLGGLKITGGKGELGGGINASGFFSLKIHQCEISNNRTNRIDEFQKVTAGAGIYTSGQSLGSHGGGIYGPLLTITQSAIIANSTSINDQEPQPATDLGGGMYLGTGTTLQMYNSQVVGNTAENGAAGVYFEGGAFYESADQNNISSLFSTFLRISQSNIDNNVVNSLVGKGSGGALVVAGPTGGLVSDTTFSQNVALQDAGAAWLTGRPAALPGHDVSYSDYVGRVTFVACTFSGNIAAKILDDGITGDKGSGGAIVSDGVVNEVYVVNSTLSANQTISGKGGAVFISPAPLEYSYRMKYDINYDGRSIKLADGQSIELPLEAPIIAAISVTSFSNSTIAENAAGATQKMGDPSVVYGGRGGGMAVQVNEKYQLEGMVSVNSTIVGKNNVPGIGFGPDIWLADDNAPIPTTIGLVGQHNLVSVGDIGKFGLGGIMGTKATPLDAKLGPLAFNGGVTKTHAVDMFSPAFNKGFNGLPQSRDQRGIPRTLDGATAGVTDVGAFEAITFQLGFPDIDAKFPNQRSMVIHVSATFDFKLHFPSTVESVFDFERVSGPPGPLGDVPFTANAALITPPQGVNQVTQVIFSFPASSFVDDGIFGRSLLDGRYKITLVNSNVDTAGTPNGATFGTSELKFHRLFGDVDGNATVTQTEFLSFAGSFGGTGFSFDYNQNGTIDTEDFNAFRARFGSSV